MNGSVLDCGRLNGDNDFFFFFFKKALIVICVAMHICFGQQSYYYISHATCVSTWMHLWGCQGLDRGLVPMWIKSRWRPWQGRKTPVSHILVFYSAFTSTLPMAAWHVQQGRLGFILECTVVCKTRKGTKPSALLCMLFLLMWLSTSYERQMMLACIEVKRHLKWPQNEHTCGLKETPDEHKSPFN